MIVWQGMQGSNLRILISKTSALTYLANPQLNLLTKANWIMGLRPLAPIFKPGLLARKTITVVDLVRA